MIGFDSVKLKSRKQEKNYGVEEVSLKEMAIVGVAGKLPRSNTIEDFWKVLQNGVDCIDHIPEGRKQDIIDALRIMEMPQDGIDKNKAALLDQIDMFDYNYFKLSPKESSMMDPNQRIFLETAWEAMEDAGYGGGKLKGSRTGVYVGFSSDSEYRKLLSKVDASSISMALPGNVKPIVASRLSYLMDFRGPSMIVDTTCSSSLVAVHLAVRAIRNGECDMAVVGGSQLHLIPVRDTKIGVESSDWRAKTFDDLSDGTGTGEGVVAMLIKPLWKAVKDRDNIYAVIEGSAVNHDGNSNGLTAPNAAAQEDVLVRAWEDAGVNPETITYIEAHGTGTKLGDPIEIEGIQRAFRRYTDRKQFCAVGTVKTNIGHLDNSAGIAGLLKAILSLKHKKLVPSLHFNRPNSNIDFADSPVYVSTRLTDWKTEGCPRRCGVSAFGLSGTNCHVILKEAPQRDETKEKCESALHVLSLSAKSEQVLKNLIMAYREHLNAGCDSSLEDICYTANTGRGHYRERLAIIFSSREELVSRLEFLSTNRLEAGLHEGIYYSGQQGISPETKEHSDTESKNLPGDINAKIDAFVQSGKSSMKELEEICQAYLRYAEIDWERLYKGEERWRVRLPVYPFERKRCWLNMENIMPVSVKSSMPQTGKPLLDRCITESPWLSVYSTDFSIERHWVLNEHKIDGNCVLVGTTHLEMAMEACIKHFPQGVCFDEVQFLTPLFIQPGEVIETQLVLRSCNSGFEFHVASRHETDDNRIEWIKHVEGKVSALKQKACATVDILNIKNSCSEDYVVPDIESYNALTSFEFGPRWKNIKEIFIGSRELVSCIEMPEQFRSELPDYPLHPSMLDNALATIPLLNKALSKLPDGKGRDSLYLPFAYKGVKVYSPLPEKFYSHVKLRGDIEEEAEIAKFSIEFIDASGNVFVEIEEYSLKKARKSRLGLQHGINKDIFYTIGWSVENTPEQQAANGCALLFRDESGTSNEIERKLKDDGWSILSVDLGHEYSVSQTGRYTIGNNQEDYDRLLEAVDGSGITHIFHMASLTIRQGVTNIQELESALDRGIYSLFRLCRSIVGSRMKGAISLVVLAEYAGEVLDDGRAVKPENAALFGLAKVLEKEYPNLKVKCIDTDSMTPLGTIYKEMLNRNSAHLVAFRKGLRYFETLERLKLEQLPDSPVEIREDGVYLITGGAGGIGLEIGRYLAAKGRVNLALLGRSPLPARSEWDSLSGIGAHEKTVNRIRTIQEIEKTGAKVEYFCVDVSSGEELQKVLDRLKSNFGRINGIIHSAGIAGDGFVIRKEESRFKQVLHPKVQGTWLLHHLTESEALDFFILFSSNNTLEGMPGQGDYTAANSYLDAFAFYRNGLGKRTTTINWTAWKETGMALEYGVANDGLLKAISTADALGAFEKVVNKDIGRVIIGELNDNGSVYGYTLSDMKLKLSDEIKQGMEKKTAAVPEVKHAGSSNAQIKLKGKVREEYTETERSIALIWKEVLGFEEYNVNDSFFDIGGDSIMITKVHAAIDEKYPGKVLVGDLFAYPTISKIAEFIGSEGADAKPAKIEAPAITQDVETDIMALFDEIEKGNLSVDKADELMRQLGKGH